MITVAVNSKCSVSGSDAKEVFESLAKAQKTFQDDKCGACGNEDITYVVREAADDDGEKFVFYEMWCPKCKSKLSFGQGKDGSLYPKRCEVGKKGKVVKDEEGNTKYLPNNGWVKYEPSAQES